MKRFILLFLLLGNNFDIMTTEKDEMKQSLYSYYFFIKETCKVFAYSYFMNEEKIENAKIACCQCHMNVTSGYLWGHCAGACNESIIKELVPLIYNGSKEELVAFLLASYENLEIPCIKCQRYNGYYIVE
jgi:hypothetical protein